MSDNVMVLVGDIIDIGESIPDDVTRVTDREGDGWARVGDGIPDGVWQCDKGQLEDVRSGDILAFEWGPLTVTAVREPEPEAKVGDLIAEGPIPANVVEGVIAKTTWTRTDAGWQSSVYPGTPYAGVHTRGTDHAVLSYGQMVVTSVAADEPQQAAPSVLLDLVRQHGDEMMHYGEGSEVRYTESASLIFDRIAALVPQQPLISVPLRERDELRAKLTESEISVAAMRATLDRLFAELDVEVDVEALAAIQVMKDALAIAKLVTPPADPSVLSLPQVPPGTVALITRNRDGDEVRFIPAPGHPDSWVMASGSPTGDWLLVEILRAFDGSVTVVMREPRTWPRLDAAPDDLRSFKGASGKKYMRHQLQQLDRWHAQGNDAEDWRPMAYWQQVDGPLEEVFE